MTEQRGAVSGPDPAELWRQWMESGSKVWSEMAGAQGRQVDPYGAYRRWFEGVQEIQERMVGTVPERVAGDPGVNDLWRRWFELSLDSWRKTAEMGQNAMEVLPRWMQMLDEARTNLLAGGAPPSDPLQFAAQWYNATSGPFSDFVGDVIEREEFLEPSSRFLQSYASFYKVFKRNSEDHLKNLQLPVRSDISRIAGLVVNLEEKVDRIEEVLEDFEYGYAEPATTESIERLETRLDRVEGKLDRLLVALEGGIEDGGPRAETNGAGGEIKATDAARREAREMGVDLAEVAGTGADGQVTVEDVRKKGES
ncbi:MAG: E3 binding domain-containing protein [Actinomycetota bacterium]|nr:E3 binding domain-containing protein [Actinomycetota bacterium]HWS81029.1 E3 binding domain-containing protein [Rubrobacter sp.]